MWSGKNISESLNGIKTKINEMCLTVCFAIVVFLLVFDDVGPGVSSPAILRSILEPIPTGIFIIPVGIANYPHL